MEVEINQINEVKGEADLLVTGVKETTNKIRNKCDELDQMAEAASSQIVELADRLLEILNQNEPKED